MPIQRHVRKADIQGTWPNMVAGPQPFRVMNCCHCHPADGAFDTRDALVYAISPKVLPEASKEVEKSVIAS